MTKEKPNNSTLSDTKILTELIESENLSDDELEAFSEMLDGLNSGEFKKLSLKQRDWAEIVHEKLNLDPGSVNLVSSGQVKVTDTQREDLKKFLEKSTGPKRLRPPGKAAR